MKTSRPVMRYHGGKFRLAPWIMQFFPPHRIYVEPFGGAGGVLIQKPRVYSEVYNDLDSDVVNLFRVLRDRQLRLELIEAVVMTPYAREEFEMSWLPTDDPVERARRIVVRASMGFGSAGATKGSTGFRIDSKREYETAQHTWAMQPDALAAAGERLAGVLIENRPAIDIIESHDSDQTLFYVDPPYVHDTRCFRHRGGHNAYRFEMADEEHLQLLEILKSVSGMVVLSGYPSELYTQALSEWECHQKEARISAGRGTTLRTECVWLNPACSKAFRAEVGMFAERVPA